MNLFKSPGTRWLCSAGLIAALVAFAPTPPGNAQQAPAAAPTTAPAPSPFTGAQRSAIEAIIKEYILQNPEILLEAQTALEARMEKIQAERLQSALKENAAEIFKRADAPTYGNAKGDITVVEFFDYNCGYCKRALGDIAKLIEADPKVKVVFKELPILSRGSEEAARVALAARVQGKYWPVHRALLGLRGEVNKDTALKAAEKVGVDMAKLRTDMDSEPVKNEIDRVRDLAKRMGIQGTPHFLVGDRAIAGAPGNLLDQMQRHIAELRKTGCSVC